MHFYIFIFENKFVKMCHLYPKILSSIISKSEEMRGFAWFHLSPTVRDFLSQLPWHSPQAAGTADSGAGCGHSTALTLFWLLLKRSAAFTFPEQLDGLLFHICDMVQWTLQEDGQTYFCS